MLRDIFAITVSSVVCGYAAWQGLQFLAVVALLALLCIFYKERARRAVDLVMELLRNTSSAKYGELEIQIEKKLQDLSQQISQAPNWVRIIASKLDSSHIGLILSIYRAGEYPLPDSDSVRDKMRDLRANGLISHDARSMAESTRVSLSESGVEFAKALLESPGVMSIETRNVLQTSQVTTSRKPGADSS